MRSYFVSLQIDPVSYRILSYVLWWHVIILFHAFTRMGTTVSWLKGDSSQKTQEARSLVSIISKPLKFLPLLILLALGERDHSLLPVWTSSGVSLLDYSQDIADEVQGASNQHLVQSHHQIKMCQHRVW